MPDRMLQITVDFSLKSDSTAPTFKGTSKDWRANYLPKLESHLNGRNLADLAKLGAAGMFMVQTDGSTQEAERVRVLGGHCKRGLYMRLDVPVKKEPESRGSSEKPPKPKDDAATSSMMTTLLGFQPSVGVGQDDSGPAELQGMSEPEELEGRMHAVYPGEAATKLKMRKLIFDRCENILEDIEAIPFDYPHRLRATVGCAVAPPHPQCTGTGAAHDEGRHLQERLRAPAAHANRVREVGLDSHNDRHDRAQDDLHRCDEE